MSSYQDAGLKDTFTQDKKNLENSEIPIVTVSATFQEDLKGAYNLPENDLETDVVFSRAHYSMAFGVLNQAWQDKIDPSKAWMVDPTNYVNLQNWKSVKFTEFVGKTLARIPVLKKLKDLADKFARNSLPILESITPPLQELTADIDRPILSFHIAAGNILLKQGKTVIQMVTDPHVREDYLNQADNPNLIYLVFNKQTKEELINKAQEMKKTVPTERVIVTGPPVDPRIVSCRQHKQPWQPGQNHPLRLCLTTGGLGTNKPELKKLLQQLLPEIQRNPEKYQLLVYAGTHLDIAEMVKKISLNHGINPHLISPHDPAQFTVGQNISQCDPQEAARELAQQPISLIYHPQIVDVNELLIKYAFPWADGFVTKPSGDMAYDAVASGCFLLTLKEWGEWEYNIRQIFTQEGVARPAVVDNFMQQLEEIKTSYAPNPPWITQAMQKALNIDELYLKGAKNIISATQTLMSKSS